MALATWTGPNVTNGACGQQPTVDNRICVIPAFSVGQRMFESILVFYPVDYQEDNGLHTCQMAISSNTTFFLKDSLIEDATDNGIVDFIVQGLCATTHFD